MDIYIKSLTINPKANADEITKSFAKVLKWLSEQTAYTDEYSFKYIETFIKSVLFLYENYTAHGDEILKNLSLEEPFYKRFFETYIHRLSTLSHISSLGESILTSSNLISNSILLDNIFKYLKEFYPTLEIADRKHSKGLNSITGDKRKKMIMIINRLFRMPCSQLKIALERICHRISFDIFGLIFTEDCSSTIFDKCTILVNMLSCEIVERSNTQLSRNFIRSINGCIMSSIDGKIFYEKCLKNERFTTSICEYLRNFVKNLCSVGCTPNTAHHGIPTMELFYLFYISLEIMPNKLLEACSGVDLSNFLTKLFILFE